jgi:glycosyltransferase involved in cell wall biosynthesis
LRAVRRTVDALPNITVRATIVGEGPERSSLERLARSLDLDDRIEFLVDPKMEDVYKAASVLLLTSDKEGTPNVVLEAMATGVPVVAFGIGGVPEIIRSPDVGVLVPPGDEDAMTEAVIELCKHPDRRSALGTAARTFVEANRSPAALVKHLSTLYRRVVGQRRPRRNGPEPGF